VGFYSAAIIGGVLILLVMSVLHRLDDIMVANTRNVDLYMEFQKMSDLGAFMAKIKEFGMKISEIEMTKSNSTEDIGVAVLITLKLEKKKPHTEIIELLSQIQGVIYLEEI
jgi:putative Mg2+ transporter-C (MgtC) family protein